MMAETTPPEGLDGIEAEIAVLMQLLDGAAPGATDAALADNALMREEAADLGPRERYKPLGPTLTKVAAASIATLPAVLAPVPAFAGTPLPPNLMLAMAARPAAPPTHDVPPALAATGPQLFPFTRPMQAVRTQIAQAPLGAEAATPEAPKFALNPRLRSIFSEQRQVAITTKGQLAATLYKVKSGDSLYTIAKATLGSGARWREIYEGNKDKIGDHYLLMPGQRLAIATQRPASAPMAAAQMAAAPVTAKGEKYVVSAGDNLYTIAHKRLGNANRWREIVMMNKAMLNGRTLIYPNQWLVLPTSSQV